MRTAESLPASRRRSQNELLQRSDRSARASGAIIAERRKSAASATVCIFAPRSRRLRYRDKGIDFVPGEDLLAKRHYIFPPQDADFYPDEAVAPAWPSRNSSRNQEFFRERFWDNGLVLAGGREFTAHGRDEVFHQGTRLPASRAIRCTTATRTISSKPGMDTGAACTQCHTEPQYNTAFRRAHASSGRSTGSNCLNCHMPRTTYALFRAISSHQIESPDLAGSVEHGVPNACNLCHLGQDRWHGHRIIWPIGTDMSGTICRPSRRRSSAALVWMLKGHAAQRVIVAWHAGWKPAQDASGADWLAPFLSELLADPYGVVRYVAGHSLTTLPNFEQFEYDFMAPADKLAGSADSAANRWRVNRRVRLAGPDKMC